MTETTTSGQPPAAPAASAADPFHLVLPSLPGYGFSGEPTEVGWDPGRVAQAWAKLMGRLGYGRYVAQGGDVGAAVTDAMALQAPDGLVGIHLNFLRRPPLEVAAAMFGGAPVPQGLTEPEGAAFAAFRAQFMKGYIAEQGQSPQTIGYPLTDSPVGPAAWMLDHDTDSYFDEVDRGGHFAAWEEPRLFTDELRAAFRSLR
jgi:pimeloyl-ACP methyl ester carboxylesterase